MEHLQEAEWLEQEQALIESLRAGAAEAADILTEWTREQEANVGPSSEEQIYFERKRARLYRAAGLTEEARQAFEDARQKARGDNNIDLLHEIEKEMEELGF